MCGIRPCDRVESGREASISGVARAIGLQRMPAHWRVPLPAPLRRGHVSDRVRRAVCVLILRATKRGFDQRVVLGNASVVGTIRSFLEKTPYSDGMAQLAPCSYAQFARAFALGVRLLQLPGTSWRSHSLRRGGATALMESGWAFADVKLYGRWASESSAREYIRLGQSALARLHHTMPPDVWRKCDLLAGGCRMAFEA